MFVPSARRKACEMHVSLVRQGQLQIPSGPPVLFSSECETKLSDQKAVFTVSSMRVRTQAMEIVLVSLVYTFMQCSGDKKSMNGEEGHCENSSWRQEDLEAE